MSQLNLVELQEKGLLPDLESLEVSECLEVGKFMQMSEEEAQSVDIPIVIDDAVWAGRTLDKSVVYSGVGDRIGQQIRKNKFVISKVDNDQVIPESYFHLILNHNKNKELLHVGSDLEQLKNATSLQGLASGDAGDLSALEKNLMESGVQPMTQFTEGSQSSADPSAEKISEETGLKTTITSSIKNIETADAGPLHIFNRGLGYITGYITNTDAKIDFTTVAEPYKENGQVVLDPSAPAEQKDLFQRGETHLVSKTWLLNEYRIRVRESKPGKVLAIHVSIPAGGLVDLHKFREPGILEPDRSNRVLVHRLLNADMYPAFLDFYFGSRIKENPATHGGRAGEVVQKSYLGWKKVEGQQVSSQRLTRRLVPTNRRSLLLRTNYLPIKTYETIRLGSQLTEEQVRILNESAFYNLVHSKNVRNRGKNRFELLASEDAQKVWVENDVIHSRFFTTNVAEMENLEVRPFYDPRQGEPLEVLEIPVKERKPNRTTGELGRPRHIMYDVTNEDVLANPETRAKTSLYSGRFNTFIEAVGPEEVSVEKLRELVKSSRARRGSKRPGLTEDIIMKLHVGNLENRLDPEEFVFGDTTSSTYERLSETIGELLIATTGN